jgi:WD40 repeat protein
MGGGETGELGMMTGFTFSSDGKSLISKANTGSPTVWDITTGQRVEVESGLSHSNGMALSSDGRILAYGKCEELDSRAHCSQYEISLWDVVVRQPLGPSLLFRVGAPAPLGLLFSPDGKTLAVLSSGTTGSGKIELFDVITRQPMVSPLEGKVRFSSMAYSPDGNFMALGDITGTIYLWDVKSRQVLSQLIGEKGPVTSVIFSPNGRILASRILIPSTVRVPHEQIVLWDMGSLQTIGQPLTGQTAIGSEIGLISTAFSPDSTILAAGTDDGTVILWDFVSSFQSP